MKKILIIDDDINYTPSLKQNIEDSNEFKVVWIEEPGEAMTELSMGKYDAVILDIMMPTPDSWGNSARREADKGLATGIVLFNQIRERYPHLPILIYSAKEGIQTDKYSYYIRKPELSTVIVQQLNKLIKV